MTDTTGPVRRARAVKAPADRKPKTARTRRPTAAELAAAEAVTAEVDREAVLEEDDGLLRVPFGEHVMRVTPPGEWRQSTNDALIDGRFNDWARAVLDEDSLALWYELDPTNREVLEFANAAANAFGESLPNSQAASTSSRAMRRRSR